MVATPVERFFFDAWEAFLDGYDLDGPALGEAIVKAGLGEWREATAEDVKLCQCEIEEGDPILVLTEAGKAAVNSVNFI